MTSYFEGVVNSIYGGIFSLQEPFSDWNNFTTIRSRVISRSEYNKLTCTNIKVYRNLRIKSGTIKNNCNKTICSERFCFIHLS